MNNERMREAGRIVAHSLLLDRIVNLENRLQGLSVTTPRLNMARQYLHLARLELELDGDTDEALRRARYVIDTAEWHWSRRGKLWVRTGTPNTVMFTDDSGNDYPASPLPTDDD